MKSLNVILDLIRQLVEYIKLKIDEQKKKALEGALDETLEQKDTSKFEEALGGSAGPVSDDKYPGVYTRKKENKK